MEEQRNFKAFISYRHCPLDMAVAKRVQTLIERYRIPREFRKNGEKSLGLVFRDESELPLSSNLTEDIYAALDHSEFLIVICTPETPKSLWVAQEINYFIRTHGRERILAVLAAGTPDESLPPALTHVYAEDGSVVSRIEPLCANLVAENQKEVLKRLKLEFIRLVAAMLRVPYDNLYQRRKRYLRRLTAALVGSVTAVVVLVMGLLISWNLDVTAKNEEIARNYRLAQEKESQALSLLSGQYLASGDRNAALESGLQALEGDRPYLAAAEGALAKALNPYGNGMLNYHLTLELPGNASCLALSEDGTRLVIADGDNRIRCYDTADTSVVWEYQIDPALASLTVKQMYSVCADRYLLVHTYDDAILLLSLEDGSKLHEKKLVYETTNISDNVELTLSAAKDRFSLHYQLESEPFYEVYEIEGLSLLDTVAGGSGYECFFDNLPAGKGQEPVPLWAVFEDAGNCLTVSAGITCVLEDFKPDDASMKMTQLQSRLLDDGSLVLMCCLEDNKMSRHPDYPNLNYMIRRSHFSIHKISPQGEEVYRQRYPLFSRQEFVGDYLALFEDDYNSTMEFTSFGTKMTLLDITNDFAETVLDFGSVGVHDYYIREDGELVTVMTDGSVLTPLKESYGITYTKLPNYDQPVREVYAAKTGTELICLRPENTPNQLVMLRSARNPEARALEDNGNVILFPSRDRFLTLTCDTVEFTQPTVARVYDMQTLEQLDQFTLGEWGGYCSVYGFSQDETKIYFGNNMVYAYDMTGRTTETVRDLDDIEGVIYDQPQVTQKPGETFLTVMFGGLEDPNSLYWYRNLEKVGTFHLPCEADEVVFPDWVNWQVSGNGLVVCSVFQEDGGFSPKATFVWSPEEQICRRVPNLSEEDGTPTIGVGNVTKTVAFASTDGILRLYDFDKDEMVNSYALPVSTHEISALQFVGEDQFLLVFKRNGSVTILKVADGTVMLELLLDDPINGYSELIREDPANGYLYLCTGGRDTTGYLVDMQSWTVIANIPGLAAYLPESGWILQRDFYTGELLASRRYACEELIDQARQLLNLS